MTGGGGGGDGGGDGGGGLVWLEPSMTHIIGSGGERDVGMAWGHASTHEIPASLVH